MKIGEAPFDDVHVLTGSLKLFFRELPEPLFPFDFYNGFVEAISKCCRLCLARKGGYYGILFLVMLWNSIPDDVRRSRNLRNVRTGVNSANA